MPMLSRKTVIKVKIETTMGTKVAGDQAIFAFDLDIKPTAPGEDRVGTGLYLGRTEPLALGERVGTCSFSTELRGNGTTGLEAGLAILLQASGCLKTSETYNLHSTFSSQKAISIDVWKDGLKFGLAGAMGSVEISGEAGKRVMCKFDFNGIWQAPVDEALPAFAPSTTLPMKFQSGTFSIGGTAKKVSKFSLNFNNQVVPEYDINAAGGVATYIVSDYDPQIQADAELETVAANNFFGQWLAGTELAIVVMANDGTTKATITMPAVSYKELSIIDRDGIAAVDITGQCSHSSGNDAVTIVAASV